MIKLMKCGCAANSKCNAVGNQKFNPPLDSCAIHGCTEEAGIDPDLSNRKAMCDCGKEVASIVRLAFFEYRPDRKFDKFYCGHAGWN